MYHRTKKSFRQNSLIYSHGGKTVSKILLVEKYSLVRAGIKRLLLDHDMVASVSEAASGAQALVEAKDKQPDIVVMNLGSDHLSVFDVLKRMLANNKQLKVIVLTNQTDEPFPSRILKAGAMACLGKRSSINDLFSAVKAARVGKRYVSTDMARRMAEKSITKKDVSPFISLSNRELQIMLMFVKGQKVQAIADTLCLSPKTVSTYRYRIFNKLDVRGDVEMTHMAIRHGVLEEANMQMTEYRKAS